MGLTRLLIIAFVVWVAWLIYRRLKVAQRNKEFRQGTPLTPNFKQCKICKLHVLEKEVLHKNGDYYCSREHFDIDS